MFYKLISKLLDYPDAALSAALPELRDEIKQGSGREYEAAEWVVLDRFLNHLTSLDLLELQAAYVQTFDLTPEHALHLTHHLFGDDKNRGPALIDLTEFYKEYGVAMRTADASKAANDEVVDDGMRLAAGDREAEDPADDGGEQQHGADAAEEVIRLGLCGHGVIRGVARDRAWPGAPAQESPSSPRRSADAAACRS